MNVGDRNPFGGIVVQSAKVSLITISCQKTNGIRKVVSWTSKCAPFLMRQPTAASFLRQIVVHQELNSVLNSANKIVCSAWIWASWFEWDL